MIKINIIVGKTVVAQRSWSAVPAQGDRIEVDNTDPKKPTLLVVKETPIWKRSFEAGYAIVDLICVKAK